MYVDCDTDKPFATVTVSIRPACVIRTARGQLSSAGSGCRWALRLLGHDGDVLNYDFSRSLTGNDCTLGTGTLTLQADGTLVREHLISGSESISGALRRLPGRP